MDPKTYINRFNESCKNAGLGRPGTWISELGCFLRHGSSPDDYFYYEFYKKSGRERAAFMTYGRSRRIIRKYNDPAFTDCFEDKCRFNRVFAAQIHREWLDLGKASDGEFEAFVRRHGTVLIKPRAGGQGKGIFKLTADGLASFDLRKHQNFLAEEYIRQHPLLASLNPTSVNTVRVVTFRNNVIACLLRIGEPGAIVDNIKSNGICAHLDIGTGIIDYPGADKKRRKFLFHPANNTLLVGFRVPNWDRVLDAAVTAAKTVPQVQYVGWDIAVTQEGTELIEGNHDPGHHIVQMTAQTGYYREIRRLASAGTR